MTGDLLLTGQAMGRIFLQNLGGDRIFTCTQCGSYLTSRKHLMSNQFTGATGRAYLFRKCVNLAYSGIQDRMMLTGRHMVRDVACKKCSAKLGWMYEFATCPEQRYKEGKTILEKALITETTGFDDYPPGEEDQPNDTTDPYA